MSDFIATLPRPIEMQPSNPLSLARVTRGREAFKAIGCAVCHAPDLGGVNGLYSDLLLHDMGPYLYDYDAAEPHVISQKLANEVREVPGSGASSYHGASTTIGTSSEIPNSFQSHRGSSQSDDFVTLDSKSLGRQVTRIDGTQTSSAQIEEAIGIDRKLRPSNTSQEWRTPPLWGVADSSPYMHDGRAETLLEAIMLHDGESAGTRDRFLNLSLEDRRGVIAFLETLQAQGP